MRSTSENIWQIQADTKGRGDFDFFVTTDEKYCIYYPKIDEYGMMKFFSPVQIWTDKKHPRMIFQTDGIKFEYQFNESCYYLNKSNVIILLTPCFYKNYFDLLYILLNFNQNLFAVISAQNFKFTEVKEGIIQQDIYFRYGHDEELKAKISKDDGKLLGLSSLEWHDIKLMDKACSFLPNNR